MREINCFWLCLFFLLGLSSLVQGAPAIFHQESAPSAFSRTYVEKTQDLSLKVRGGSITVERTYGGSGWSFNRGAKGLTFAFKREHDAVPDKITRFGETYKLAEGPEASTLSNASQVYLPERTSEEGSPLAIIEKVDDGFRWSNKISAWEQYADDGSLLETGRWNSVHTKTRLDAQRRIWELQDAEGHLLLTYEYTTPTSDQIRRVTDYSGRVVEYGWTGDQLTSVTDVLGKTWQYSYDARGRLTLRTDPLGNKLIVQYDPQGFVSRIENGQGYGTRYVYDFNALSSEFYLRTEEDSGRMVEKWFDSTGLLRQLDINGHQIKNVEKLTVNGELKATISSDAYGYAIRHSLDQWGNVIKAEYVDGSIETARYSQPDNQLVEKVNRKGVKTRYDYDSRGNLVRITEALGLPEERIVEYAYDSMDQRLSATYVGDDATATAVYQWGGYDAYGNPAEITDAEGHITRYRYNVLGQVTSLTDARGGVWKLTYDNAGNPLSQTDPLNRTQATEYDGLGRQSKATQPNGAVISWQYDAEGRVKQQTRSWGGKTETTQAVFDNLTNSLKVTDPLGSVARYDYNPLDQISRYIDPNGNITSVDYQGMNPVAIHYPTFTETRAYDPMRQLVSRQVPFAGGETSTTALSYNTAGEQIEMVDAKGQKTAVDYDALGRVVSQIDALGGVTAIAYDDRNNVLMVTDPENRVTRFEYDRNNRRTAEIISPTASAENIRRWSYDGNGNLSQMISPNGEKTAHEYDLANQRTKTSTFAKGNMQAPEQVTLFTYNLQGRLESYDDQLTRQTFSYDGWGRLLSSTVNFGVFSKTFAYTYDANNRKTSYSTPEGLVYHYTYDPLGNLTSIKVPGEGLVTYSDYQWHKPGKVSYPGGAALRLEYDPLQRPVTRELFDAMQTSLASAAYTYDVSGNITAIETDQGAYQYGYDALNRLVSAENPGMANEAYSYDGVGNRLTSTQTQGEWRYNGANQLMGMDETTYQYSANGHRTHKTQPFETTSYHYNAAERLSVVERNQVEIASYRYNPMGMRVSKQTAQGIRYFLYSQEGLVAEYDASGALMQEYQYQPGGTWMTSPVFQKSEGYEYFATDHLGMAKGAFAGDGSRYSGFQYSAFGEVGSSSTALRFPGQYADDETGLYQNYFRDYDPGIGRYVQRDPIGLFAGLNTYSYASNNSINSFDPYGLYDPQNYTEAQTREFLAAARNQTFWQAMKNHGGGGIYDFAYVQKGSTFILGGVRYDAAQFGNVLAGYTGAYLYDLPGVLGVVTAGIVYDTVRLLDGKSIDLDRYDRDFILEGAAIGMLHRGYCPRK
ncbi:MAG: RHS repeat protein [Hahellaceae bacterium]|nr:RHS repeat protein [Hahellaceae bacterium]